MRTTMRRLIIQSHSGTCMPACKGLLCWGDWQAVNLPPPPTQPPSSTTLIHMPLPPKMLLLLPPQTSTHNTGRSIRRNKGLGIRRVVGGARRHRLLAMAPYFTRTCLYASPPCLPHDLHPLPFPLTTAWTTRRRGSPSSGDTLLTMSCVKQCRWPTCRLAVTRAPGKEVGREEAAASEADLGAPALGATVRVWKQQGMEGRCWEGGKARFEVTPSLTPSLHVHRGPPSS